jgi:hypothetical protein
MKCMRWIGHQTARESAVVEKTRRSGSGKIRIPKMVFVTLKSQDTPEVIHTLACCAIHCACLKLDVFVLMGFCRGRSKACLSLGYTIYRGIYARRGGIAYGNLPILTQCYSKSNTLLFCQAGFATDHACTGVGFKLLDLGCDPTCIQDPLVFYPSSATPSKETSTFAESVALDSVTLIGSLVKLMGHDICVILQLTWRATNLQGRWWKSCRKEP